MDLFMGNSVWQLVKQSDFVSLVVLLLLFAMSVMSWTIFISKLFMLQSRRKELQRVIKHLSSVRSIDDLHRVSLQYAHTSSGYFLTETLHYLSTTASLRTQNNAQEWDTVQYHIEQTIDRLIEQEESYLPALLTSAAVSPLLGLFGTVWGLIHAFIRISEKQSADITVVAPGIAEALITTLAGLIVAIPALVMYNYLAVKVRNIESQMLDLADKVSLILQQSLVR